MNLVTLKGQSTGSARIETYLEREWVVVPVVALVEGVIHAANSPQPEFVPEATYSVMVGTWNGRPVFVGHPQIGGEYVAGNVPEVLEALAVGQVFNTALKDGKLTMEAWLDKARAEEVPALKDLLERIDNLEPVEISVGVFVKTTDEKGEYNGKKFLAVWADIAPDHLALLPEGQVGACSREMGCGVRAATKGEGMSEPKRGIWDRMLSMIRSARSAEEMTDGDIARKIGEALTKLDPRAWYPEAVNQAQGWFTYCVYTGDGHEFYKRNFTLAEGGEVTIDGDPVRVEPVTKWEEVGAADGLTAASQPTVAAAPCKCHEQNAATSQETRAMSKINAELQTKLEGATDEQLAAIGKVFEPAVVTPAPAAVTPVAETPAVATAKTPTFEEVLSAAPSDVQQAIRTATRQAAATKEATIKALKDSGRNTFSDEQLNGFSQDQLDALKTLAGITKPVVAATDFSGAGAPREEKTETTRVAAAPSLTDAVIASRKAGK